MPEIGVGVMIFASMEHMWLTIIRRLKGSSSSREGAQTPLELEAERLWKAAGSYKEQAFQPDVAAGWARFKESMEAEKETGRLRQGANVRFLRLASAAAGLLLLIAFAVWRFAAPSQAPEWTLLSAQEAPLEKVLLPDGSEVWLNRNSQLRYRTDLGEKKPRELFLRGEAFFEVAPIQGRPFTVQTAHAQVAVLGTRFNLRAYPKDKATEVEVEHGKVALLDHQSGQRLILGKNMRGWVRPGQGNGSAPVSLPEAQLWRTGVLTCRGTTLGRIKTLLEQQELANVEFSDLRLANCRVTGAIQARQIESSLGLLCQAAGLSLRAVEGNTFQISGVPCKE
ncbi:MAG: FecR domain-containing protein [Haliscomenobacter sp.]|nr:FecR domain-containing protein [Haliscomenobacter sp.]